MAGGAVLIPNSGKDVSWSQKLPPRNVIYPFALVTSLFFLWGFAYGLLDVLNKHFQNTLGITKLQSTGLQVAYFGVGYFAFSPIAGEVLRRRGYKFTIIMGLTFYSVGAILFWPCAKFAGESNKKAVFGGFVVCTAVIACGLASLETAANSYITCLPGTEPSGAAFRLQLSQSFNGIASFAGPFIASKYFFSGDNAGNLTNVQWVYLAVALMGVFIAFLFTVTKLPETSEAELEEQVQAAAEMSGMDAATDQPFYKQYRVFFGWLAQFMYVGAQVTIGSFFINYGAEVVGWSDAKTSNFLSYALIMFTVGRFVGLAFLTIWPAELLVGLWAIACFVLVTCTTFLHGKAGMACLMTVMFFEAPLFPCIFVISTKGMGRHTRRAASLLISAVGGGAVFPPIQGAIADAHGTRISYAINIPAFLYIAGFSLFLWFRHGAHFNLREESMAKVEPTLETAGRNSLGLRRTRTVDSKRLGEKVHADIFEERGKA
ncbi:major facilitator superfamily domain-containing protein [Rhizoctonia solani]|nr:major facilitator superfamily domain-containing protein [Rhizoctonia solani]